MATLYGFAGDSLFVVFVLCTFLGVSLLIFGLFTAGQKFLVEYKETFTETASTNMADMFLSVDATRLFYINISIIVILPALFWLLTGDLVSALALLAFLAVMPTIFYKRMRSQRLKRFESQLPDGLIMLSGAMRAGASLNIALEGLVKEQAPPLSQEFELFLREQRIGVDFDKSLEHMEKRLPISDFAMLSSALRINREIGGNLAEIIDSLATTLRRKQQMEGKIQSLTAQGRLQGIVMTGLPVFLAILLYFMDPKSMSKLWSTWPGWITLAVVFVMECMGYVFIRKITRIDV